MLLLSISHVVTLMNKEPFVKVIENNVVVIKKHIAIRVTEKYILCVFLGIE